MIEHPATMTQGDWTGVTDEERAEKHIAPGFIRLRYPIIVIDKIGIILCHPIPYVVTSMAS